MLHKIKDGYALWYSYYQILPKTHKYSLGQKIDSLFVEIIETVAAAGFIAKEKKLPYLSLAIMKVDTLKVLTMVLWENKSLDDKKYIQLSLKIDELGKMLGGWRGKLQKQNSPHK
ncbi:MAG: four helix bundle protein [Patescibacteria group bacterium]